MEPQRAPATGATTSPTGVPDGVPLFNPFDPGFLDDPYRQYRAMRESEPVHRSPLDVWVLFRYADCFDVLRDASTSVSFERALELGGEVPNPRREMFEQLFPDRERREMKGILTIDPPDHTRLRRLVAKVFTPRRVEELRPMVQQLVDGMLDAFDADQRDGAEPVDLISRFAFPLPFAVICDMLGMPEGDRDQLRAWSGTLVRLLDPIVSPDEAREGVEAFDHVYEHVAEVIAWKRDHLDDDLLSALITAEDEGDVLSPEELADQVTLLFLAGHETTVNLIGNGVLALLRNRDQLELLQRDPSITANAVDELLRYDSPVQFSRRIAVDELHIGDVTFERGELIMTCLGAANHDPAVFGDDADVLDLRRPSASRLLSFGSGLHHCLGAALARLEGQVAIGKLVRRFPDLELAASRPAWSSRIVLRGVTELPVHLSAAR